MFLIYVNEIPGIITSTDKLFADDTKIYRQINNIDDSIALQIDLTTLDLWADRWQMKFNSTKCEVMRITHNRDKKSMRYNISSTVLRNVSNYKDLGVIMSSDLKWSKHVEQIVHKANKVLGLLKRTVGGKNKGTFSNLYKTLVRPILEYACPVWSPHLMKDIDEIEKIKRRASRIALGQRRQEMAYTERCKILKWNSLVQRRDFLSLVECYKTVFNLNGLNFSEYFELCKNTKSRSNHPHKLQLKLLIVFSATQGNSEKGDIALDEIYLSHRKCAAIPKLPPESCPLVCENGGSWNLESIISWGKRLRRWLQCVY
ncbi:uncharacterized protein LOC124440511 [Xenia sp. Carnegie-2017]|uniref:uncharacterized protein LOC124440511 n=1 Tax=Xenia sp. Carnegie-2017 TaxID=2897299 RepID=UPI001F04DC3C|nr:uncharacterized protein LOC124440511 [Xenia sp. Carnegie-2017]